MEHQELLTTNPVVFRPLRAHAGGIFGSNGRQCPRWTVAMVQRPSVWNICYYTILTAAKYHPI
jgi:hypothetical protein